MILLTQIPEEEMSRGQPDFLIKHLVFWRVENRAGKVVVCFGKVSISPVWLGTLIVIAAALIWGALSATNEIITCLSYIFLAGLVAMILGFIFYSAQQQEYRGIEMEIEPGRCVARRNTVTQALENVVAVVVVNAARYRSGDLATEGAPSELFILRDENGKHLFVPIASEGQEGQCSFLAKTLATALQVEIRQMQRG
jgi:hypothetical protein